MFDADRPLPSSAVLSLSYHWVTDRSFDVAGPWKLSALVRLIEDFGHFRKLYVESTLLD